jgi:hypothetical protein
MATVIEAYPGKDAIIRYLEEVYRGTENPTVSMLKKVNRHSDIDKAEQVDIELLARSYWDQIAYPDEIQRRSILNLKVDDTSLEELQKELLNTKVTVEEEEEPEKKQEVINERAPEVDPDAPKVSRFVSGQILKAAAPTYREGEIVRIQGEEERGERRRPKYRDGQVIRIKQYHEGERVRVKQGKIAGKPELKSIRAQLEARLNDARMLLAPGYNSAPIRLQNMKAAEKILNISKDAY